MSIFSGYKILCSIVSHKLRVSWRFITFYVLRPLGILHECILENKYTRHLLYYLLYKLTLILNTPVKMRKSLFIYLSFFIIPRILFLLCFSMDCFYRNQLDLIYNCVFIMTLPLLIRYLLYCAPLLIISNLRIINQYFLVQITSKDIIYKESDFEEDFRLKYEVETYAYDPSGLHYNEYYTDGDTTSYNYLIPSNFIEYQGDAICFDHKLYEYNILYIDEREDIINLSGYDPRPNISKMQCRDKLTLLSKLKALEMSLDDITQHYQSTLRVIQGYLAALLFICWSYILIKSFYILPTDVYTGLKDLS